MKAILLSLLLTFTPVNHYIDRGIEDSKGEVATFLKGVKWQPEAIPKHVVVYEDVLDLAYTILYTNRIVPCMADCPEVMYKDGLIHFFLFARDRRGKLLNEPGVVYVTKDVPAMYMLYDREWHWFSFEIKNFRDK